ncbi:MAG: hypothetical protein V2A72_02815 [Candidatus Omnitrophota bacterium]
MLTDRIFRYCILFSLLAHAILFLNIKPFGIFNNTQSLENIEVTYMEKALKVNGVLPEAIVSKHEKIAGNVPIKGEAKALNAEKVNIADRQIVSQTPKPQAAPAAEKIQPVKQLIPLPEIELTQNQMLIYNANKDFSSDPSYLNYHTIVRNKIKKMANASKPYIFKVGEVTLLFTILSSGDLEDASIIEEASASDLKLRQCALDSVYAASPFPLFTSDMKESRLNLQVTISFEK